MEENRDEEAGAQLVGLIFLPMFIWLFCSMYAFKKEVQAVFDPWRERGVVTSFKENPKITRSTRMEIHFSLDSLELHQPVQTDAGDLEQPLIRNQLSSGRGARDVARASATVSQGAHAEPDWTRVEPPAQMEPVIQDAPPVCSVQ